MSSTKELEIRVVSVPDQARVLEVRTVDDFIAAGELLKTIKGLRSEIDATFDPIIKKQYEAHREAIAQKKKVEAPLVEAEWILKPRIGAYLTEQERLRKEEELRLQQVAQEEAQLRQLENAAILDDLGETDEANRLLEEPVVAPPVVVPKSVPKVCGVAMTTRWSAQVVSLMDLVKAVAAGKAPLQCLQADTVFLNRQAVAMKGALPYPGVKAVSSNTISAGRR